MFSGETKVIYVIDTDKINTDRTEKNFFTSINNYVNQKEYDLIWFCTNIECVLIGNKKITSKGEEAKNFIRRSPDLSSKKGQLSTTNASENKSNILKVLDKHISQYK